MEEVINNLIDKLITQIDQLRLQYQDPTLHLINIQEINILYDYQYRIIFNIQPAYFLSSFKDEFLFEYWKVDNNKIIFSVVFKLILLTDLPEEIFNEILEYLSIDDIKSLNLVSKELYQMSSSDVFWSQKFQSKYGYYPPFIQQRLKDIYFNNNALYAFGNNVNGQLGIGEYSVYQDEPIPVLTESKEVYRVKQLACGLNHSLIFDTNLKIFGSNKYSYLVYGLYYKHIKENKPTTILNNNHEIIPKQIACGYYHSLYIDQDDSVWGFGLTITNQLINGRYFVEKPLKILITSLPIYAKSIAGGRYHSVIRDSNNNLIRLGPETLRNYGKNQYDTPDYVRDNLNQPFKVNLISAADSFSLFTDLDDNLWGFGRNNKGQLGIGKYSSILMKPVPILDKNQNPFKVKVIASKFKHSLIIDFDDTLWGFGSDKYNQLGNYKKINIISPHPIIDDDGNPIKAKYAATGKNHSLIINLNNELLFCGKKGDIIISVPIKISNTQGLPYLVKSVAAGDDFSLLRLW